MKIKVCGMRESENIRQLATLDLDYIGFIFYPKSKRFVTQLDKEILTTLPRSIKKTGVFVDETLAVIADKINEYQLDSVQLHGDETPELCKEISEMGVEVIKAFGIADNFDFNTLEPYLYTVNYFLFDTKTDDYGGSGKTFNWQVLDKYVYNKPFFLSGGLSLENISEIKRLGDSRLYAVDLNSQFELEPGIKNIENIKKAILTIKK